MATAETPGPPAEVRRLAVDRWAVLRRTYLDNLKVILVAAIIAGHGIVSYTRYTDGIWPYANVKEVGLSPVTDAILVALIAPFIVFVIALLFLVAGLLTPPSLSTKGVGRFVRGRLLRLGLPFVVFTLVLWPLLLYALYRPLHHVTGSYWQQVRRSEGFIDTGPLWFVGVLLIFSIGYAAWSRISQRGAPGEPEISSRGGRAITGRHLVLLAGGVAITTFLVRLIFPFGSELVADLNFFEWPACLALFALGIAACRQGWLAAVPDRIRRQARDGALVALAAAATLAASGDALGVRADDLWGGWHWSALAFVTIESTMAVFGSVWLLAIAQRHLDRRARLGPVLARSAYGAFILQGFVLIGLAVALRPVPAPAEIKAPLVAAGGVVGSYALAWLLVARLPGLGRLL